MKMLLSVAVVGIASVAFAAPNIKCLPKQQSTNSSLNGNGNQNKNSNANNNNNSTQVQISVNPTTNSGVKHHSKNKSSNSSSSSSSTNGGGFGGTSFNWSPIDGRQFSPSYAPGYSSGGYGGSYPTPNYGSSYNASAVPAPVANNNAENPQSAWLTTYLPNENAEVYLNGIKMPQKGNQRKYVTPPLDPKKTYHYALKVNWTDSKGNKRTYTQNIELKAGDEVAHTVPGGEDQPVPPKPHEGPAPQKVEPNGQGKADIEDRLHYKISCAQTLIKEGKVAKGKQRLQEIVEGYPETKAAGYAKKILDKIG